MSIRLTIRLLPTYAYARTEQYSREQTEEVARMAYAMDFINKMDNGLGYSDW